MKLRLAPLVLALSLGHLPTLSHAALNIPNVPLQTGSTVAPNLFYLLDDSGSMQWEIMPEDYLYAYYMFPPPIHGHVYGGEMYSYYVMKFDTSTNEVVYLRSSTVNVLYYDPNQVYKPWAKHDGTSYPNANPRSAYYNPYETNRGSIDLTHIQNRRVRWCDGRLYCYWMDKQFWPITYYVYKGTGSIFKRKSYIRYQYRNGTMYKWDLAKSKVTERSISAMPWGRSVADEVQNFANWFTYYRSRILAVRAATSQAFSTLDNNYRVGFATIHKNLWKDPPAENDNPFNTTARQDFYQRLFAAPIPPQGTPLRSALAAVGDKIPSYFGPGPEEISCRQNFTILTTDGYWNGYTPSNIGNQDGSSGSLITSADGQRSFQYQPTRPYMDSYSNTLADVAMKYWKNDLRSDLKNDVPTSAADPAFWQHMTTFALSLGTAGTLDPQTDLPKLESGEKQWPNPRQRKAYKADDLWHATINGHGEFIAAKDPQEFAEGLKKALGSIANRVGSASNAAGNSTRLETGSMVYQARYRSGVWTGELLGYKVTSAGVENQPTWEAMLPNASSRKIYSIKYDGQVPQGITFQWDNLNQAQKDHIESNDVLNYLRGDQSQEQNQGGSFRNRDKLLGDIVDSSPVYFEITNYQTNTKTKTLFLGANDGMLHAFDATTGKERFAYVPLGVYPHLRKLSEPNYNHRYFVDGEIAISNPEQTDNKAYLVAALGRGGKGLFALDVTDPVNFNTNNVLWDLTATDDGDMGYIFGKPIFANVDGLGWRIITGNGINSSNEHAVLLVIDPKDGSIDAKIDACQDYQGSCIGQNGLSTPAVFDTDGDGDVDVAYAGDQLGNLWKFDLAKRQVALGGQPLFVAKNNNNQTQPIIGAPTVVKNTKVGDSNYGKIFVFFGTGRYLTQDDPNNTDIQSWYGLIDADEKINRQDLVRREIVVSTNLDDKPVRAFSEARPNDMKGKKGWYVDLVTNNIAEGERMIGSQTFIPMFGGGGVLMASSIIPGTDACTPGGRGYFNAIDPFTGGSLPFVFFDVNDDHLFDDADKIQITQDEKLPVGSIDLGIGMPSDAILMGNWAIVSGSTGRVGAIRVNLVGTPRRIGWREIINQ